MIVHLGLCLLVLVNLMFVHITGVVGVAWVVLFGALTLLAPVLRRFADALAYRVAWNGVVLLLFASLVHRTLDQGVARMLEGGLVLAVFCQVHLVNNVSTRQRPDLLLFNSFLIAVITAFFCQEFAYCVVFVAYTFVLLAVWRLLAHRDAGGTAALPAVLRDGARQAAMVLAGTALLFLFWPRDFERQGLIDSELMHAAQAQVGITDEIRLAHKLSPVQSDRVVLKIHGEGAIPTHWRATTFRLLHGGAWHATTAAQDANRVGGLREPSLDRPWREEARGRWERPAHGTGSAMQVELCDAQLGRVPLPLDAGRLVLAPDAADVPHFPVIDGTFAYFAGELAYRVERVGPAAAPSGKRRRLDAWLGLDAHAVPAAALTLAHETRATLPADAPGLAVAQAFCARLGQDFTYRLPGLADSATSLDEFFRLRRGHCEFFASALAMMLRSQNIACRLVGGFLAVEREDDDTVLVRARHAHAWVEVWDDERGWCTFDPTPAQTEPRDRDSWFGQVLGSVESMWTAVTGFDARRREQVLDWLAAVPASALASATAHPGSWIAACTLALWFWRRRRPRTHPAVAQYARALRQARLRLVPGETPRQLLARARAAALPVGVVRALVAATERHERLRYGGERTVRAAKHREPHRPAISLGSSSACASPGTRAHPPWPRA